MAKLVMRREGTRLSCPSPDWMELLMELPEGVDLNVNATRARSLPQLGTYFGLLAWVCQNVEAARLWPSKDELSDFLQLETGFVRQIAIPTEHGPIYARVPASKNFTECSQDRFNAYMQAALDRLTRLCGYDPLPHYFAWMETRHGNRRAS
jgi:hypothetical protein